MTHPSRYRFHLTAIALAVLAGPLSAAESGKPNILLIVADDLGWGELGVQGITKDIPTPNIDSIANNGVRFTSGYVSGPYCSPTRAALLTGRYQQRFGHEFNPGPAATAGEKVGLDVTQKTAGDRLKAAGYTTAWIGKSHLGYEPEFHPLKRGFDYHFGFLGGAHDYLDADGKGRDPVQRSGQPIEKLDYLTDEIGREAAGFIEKNKAQPWFTYLAFNAVHAPLQSTDKYLSRFANITDPKRKSFAGLLAGLDDAVGVVLAKLRETHQEENTLIFFISDNGGPTPSTTSGNGPLRGFKAQTWEGGVRVAWFVQWKGKIAAGKVDERPVIQLDILPTSLAAAGVTPEADAKFDGVNLLPYLTGEKADAPHEALYWRFGQQIAIRKGDWKLVKAPGGSLPQPGQGGGRAGQLIGVAGTESAQLYNLKTDIGEQTNLADKEPEKVKELAADWDKWNRFNVQAKWVPGNRAVPALAANTATPAAPATNAPAPAVTAPAPKTEPAPASTASAKGPWKTGDSVPKADAPQIGGRGFSITAQIDAAEPKGVILAQGGPVNGYALFVNDGKLAFGIRSKKTLSVVTASKPLTVGAHRVSAQIAADGAVTLKVDDELVGEGKAGGLIGVQPGEALTVGNDGQAAVGEYTAPNEFSGKVENAAVTVL